MATTAKARHPKDVGDVSQAQVLAALVRRRRSVLVPYGDNRRYDLAMDVDGRLVRVQCKTGLYRDGAIRFPVCSTDWYRRTRRRYVGEIEYFGVYCAETAKVYMVPIGDVEQNSREVTLRVEPTRNGQSARIRWAKEYEI